jgi:hypothetical protein
MKHSQNMHYLQMIILMIPAGLLSTMNVWANSIDDIYFSFNDLYMVGLMSSWMILFMSILDGNITIGLISAMVASLFIYMIRNQSFINQTQFLRGMIPHHSMAVLMANRMKNNPNTISNLLQNIIQSQEAEIQYMKEILNKRN